MAHANMLRFFYGTVGHPSCRIVSLQERTLLFIRCKKQNIKCRWIIYWFIHCILHFNFLHLKAIWFSKFFHFQKQYASRYNRMATVKFCSEWFFIWLTEAIICYTQRKTEPVACWFTHVEIVTMKRIQRIIVYIDISLQNNQCNIPLK